jgi:hypothetical protein
MKLSLASLLTAALSVQGHAIFQVNHIVYYPYFGNNPLTDINSRESPSTAKTMAN